MSDPSDQSPSPRGSTPPQQPGSPQTHTTHELILPYTKQPARGDDPPRGKNPDIVIPKITPFDTSGSGSSSGEPLAFRARGLFGKFVDEFGNILDWDGTVLGSVEGDLPSMVGRPVSETGEILDASGEVVGYVSENLQHPPLKALEGGLKVDDQGNIYNPQGVIVGRMHGGSNGAGDAGTGGSSSSQSKGGDAQAKTSSAAAPSPSEMYLDVKSTHDGIQLIIKIPTVFNRDKS